MDVLDTIKAQRILRTAGVGGYFADCVELLTGRLEGSDFYEDLAELTARKAEALLRGHWPEVRVEVNCRKGFKNTTGKVHLFFKLY